jgi:hypothetical protein
VGQSRWGLSRRQCLGDVLAQPSWTGSTDSSPGPRSQPARAADAPGTACGQTAPLGLGLAVRGVRIGKGLTQDHTLGACLR